MDKSYHRLLKHAQWSLDHCHIGRLQRTVRRLRHFSGRAYCLGTEAAQAINDGPLDGGHVRAAIDKFERFMQGEIARLDAIAEAEAAKVQQRAKELKDIDSDIVFLRQTIANLKAEAEDTVPISAAGRLLQKAAELEKEKQDLEVERAKILKGGK